MQPTIAIPLALSVMRDLKCRHCTSFVSCGPVFVVPDGGILCGRCHVIAKPQFRNLAYETLATMFVYPCQNWSKYCNNRLQWNHAVVHEDGCPFRSKCRILWKQPKLALKSERKILVHDGFQLHHIPGRILAKLECIICNGYLSCDPLYINEDSSSICHRCIYNNGIPEGVLRNLAYEKLASVAIFPCVYKNRGCTMHLPFGRDLWRHEGVCEYNRIYYRVRNKKDNSSYVHGKEKGVIMTHSGHYYGTITSHSALWTPRQPEKLDNSDQINKEFKEIINKNPKEEECNPNFNVSEVYDSILSTTESSRKSSISRESSTSNNITRKDNLEPTLKSESPTLFQRHEVITSSENSVKKTNNFIRYSTTNYEQHISKDLARVSLRGIMSYPDNNNTFYNNNNYENLESTRQRASLKSLPQHQLTSVTPKYLSEGLVQPKRGDSFKLGSKQIISELKIRQLKQKERD